MRTYKLLEQWTWMVLYSGLILVMLWSGTKALNYAMDMMFYKDYLLSWRQATQAGSVEKGTWPEYTGSMLVHYMDEVVDIMESISVGLPDSNTSRAYVYMLKKINKPEQKIFILCFADKIILYGIREETLRRIDRFIDEKPDLNAGEFKGKAASDGITFIGAWKI